MSEAFYLPHGDGWQSTDSTRGPWHPQLQHAGPPSALLARQIESQVGDMQVVRLTIDLLKPVPIAVLQTTLQVVQEGKRRRILEARLAHEASLIAVARALLLRRQAVPLETQPSHDPSPPSRPEDCDAFQFPFWQADTGYHTAMELRVASGGPGHGAARMWMRQRIPLIPNEVPTPLQRLMLIADSGNGVSSTLDWRRYQFMNPDLNINIRRPARGEWLCLDAHSHFEAHGLGMAESRIWDETGVVANGTQNLLLEPPAS